MKTRKRLSAWIAPFLAALAFFSCDDISDYIDSYTDPDKTANVTVYDKSDVMNASFSNQMGTTMWLTIGFYENEDYVEGTTDESERYTCRVHARSLDGTIDNDYTAYAVWEENGVNRYNVYTSGGTSNVQAAEYDEDGNIVRDEKGKIVYQTDENGDNVYDTWDDTLIVAIRSPSEIVVLSGKMNNWQTKASLDRD